ncbi:MAG: hypothetical protein ACYC3S_15620 [Chloroflexota bacterium]
MNDVSLVSVLHDPDGSLFRGMGEALESLLAAHQGAYVVLSGATSSSVEAALRQAGVLVAREVVPHVGASRRQALALALADGHRWLHYCDFDRALHWARYYPEELATTIASLPAADFTVIGRTPRAFATHPACMTKTEGLANRVFALATDRAWDLCAATRGLSLAAAQVILARSQVRGVGTEGEWAALALHDGHLSLAYVAVEGMEYETADRYPQAVAAAGGVDAWTAAQSLSPANWSLRLGYAYAIADACLTPGAPGSVQIA